MSEDIKTAERVMRGMLKEEFTPATLVAALFNVLGCGKGHEHAGVTITRSDDDDFEVMMDSLQKARTHARKIEGE